MPSHSITKPVLFLDADLRYSKEKPVKSVIVRFFHFLMVLISSVVSCGRIRWELTDKHLALNLVSSQKEQ